MLGRLKNFQREMKLQGNFTAQCRSRTWGIVFFLCERYGQSLVAVRFSTVPDYRGKRSGYHFRLDGSEDGSSSGDQVGDHRNLTRHATTK
jgi:hypothetical protein